MEQVSRSINQKIIRDRMRRKIKDITPQIFAKNERYYNASLPKSQRPHEILSNQYRHFKYPQYNENGFISNRQMYSYAEMMIYEPLRNNRLQNERQRSKELSQGNQFLKNYDPKEFQIMKEKYLQRVKEEQERDDDDKSVRSFQVVNKQVLEKDKNKKFIPKKTVTLPKINREKFRKKRSLRSIFLAIYFMTFLKLNLKRFIKKKKEFNQKFMQKYIIQSIQTVKDYYTHILQQQLTDFLNYLQKKNKNPNKYLQREVMDILVRISQKILTEVPKVVLKSIMINCSNYSFYPCPFLCQAEIKRVQFSAEFGCTRNVDLDVSYMLAGIFLVIKLFTNYILYRPWEYYFLIQKDRDENEARLDFNKLVKFIYQFGSIFYFIALDKFLLNVDILERQPKPLLKIVKQFQIEPILPIIIEEQDENGQSQSNYSRVSTKKSDKTQRKSFRQTKKSQNDQRRSFKQTKKGQTNHSFTQRGTNMNKKAEISNQNRIPEEYKDRVQIFFGQNSQFYQKMKQDFKQQMQIIQNNLIKWVQIATDQSLNEYNRQRIKRTNKLLQD